MLWVNYTSTKRKVDTISPYLLTSCIKNRKWDSIQFYIHQANLPDDDYSYALHLVCKTCDTPLSILQMIYFAFPDAAVYLDASLRTPLFVAVENHFIDAVIFLSSANPRSTLICNSIGITPLQYALHDLESETILSAILRSNPSATQQLDDEGEVIFESFFNDRNCKLRALLENDNDFLFTKELEEKHWAAYSAYSKCIHLLKAVTMEHFSESSLDNDEWLALHASCKVDVCPWSFCYLLLKMDPEQIMKKDEHGNLPIHLILSASSKLSDDITIECYNCGIMEKVYYAPNKDNDFIGLCSDCHYNDVQNAHERVYCMEPVHKVAKFVEDLVAINPKMATISNRSGCYPLDISISNQQSFSTNKIIFDAHPSIGRISHTNDGLIPFMSAAVGEWDDEIDQISTIFYLLQEDPVTIKRFTETSIRCMLHCSVKY